MKKNLPIFILIFIVSLAWSSTLWADTDFDSDTDTDTGIDTPPAPAPKPLVKPKPVLTDDLGTLGEDHRPSLTLNVTPNEVVMGELVHWKLTVKRRKDDKAHLLEASFGKLEIQSRDIRTVDLDEEWVNEIVEINLISFETGTFEIDPQVVTVVDPSGNLGKFVTTSGLVNVKSLIANEPEPKLKKDEGPGEKLFEKDYTIVWVAGVLGSIILVALLTLLVRKLWTMRAPKAEPPPPPPRPAEEIAIEKLNELQRSNLLELDMVKEYHVQLSEILREYLGNRWHFDSLELSTEELILALRKTQIETSMMREALELLGDTDLVKFAKMMLSLEESRQMVDKTYQFVKTTTPTRTRTQINTDEPPKEEADA